MCTRTDALFPSTSICRSERAVLLRLLPLGETASLLAGLQVDLRLDADGRYQVQPLVAGASPAIAAALQGAGFQSGPGSPRSEEHTSALQSLMRTSYAVFCLTTKNNHPV